MRILAFAASSSTQSINKQLVAYATRLLAESVDQITVETIDLNDFEMPIYSADREGHGGIPALAHAFFDKITQADAVLVSFAEHNGSYTAAYKNLFDWASRIDMRVYQDKPAVLLSTSIAPSGAANVLAMAVNSGQFFGYEVAASLSIPNFHDHFDAATDSLAAGDLDDEFRRAVMALTTATTPSPVGGG